MRWRATDPVQDVAALILTGADAFARLSDALVRKPAPFRTLPVEIGDDWVALFAAPLEGGDEAVLPRIGNATALYRHDARWWFPVGTRLDVPDHLQVPLLAALASANDVTGPAIVVPRDGDGIDLYLVRDPVPFHDVVLA